MTDCCVDLTFRWMGNNNYSRCCSLFHTFQLRSSYSILFLFLLNIRMRRFHFRFWLSNCTSLVSNAQVNPCRRIRYKDVPYVIICLCCLHILQCMVVKGKKRIYLNVDHEHWTHYSGK